MKRNFIVYTNSENQKVKIPINAKIGTKVYIEHCSAGTNIIEDLNDIKVNVYFEDTYSNKFSSAISIETLTIEDDYDEFIKLINYHTSNNEDCNYNTWLTW
jgi:hypothetical protein